MITFLKHHLFKTVVTDYLKNKSNLKKIEDILSTPTKRNLYINTQRVAQFVSETFGVQLKIDLKLNIAKFHKMFEGKSKVIYDYEKDSEAYLDKEIPKLMKDVKKDEEVKCTLDSTQDTEKHCEVVKDEESGYYFDAVMKKVDIKKYYYGLDNFYVIQILKDEVKKLYIVWTRWGRSGSIGQYQRTPFSTLEAAKQEFCKVFKQKSGWSWKEISNYVKLPKKYEIKRLGGKLLSKSDARLKFSNRDFDYNKVVISFDDLKDKVECKSNKGIIDFLKPLVDDNEMYNSLQNSKLCNSLLLLAPQDKDTIDKGIEILNKMKVKLEEANKCRSKSNFDDYTVKMEQLANLNSEYLEVIPKTNPEHIEAILNDYQVQNEITLLKSVYSLSFKIRIALGAYQNAKKVNPYDYVLGSLPINLFVIKLHLIKNSHYLNSQPIHGHTLTNIIKVNN